MTELGIPGPKSPGRARVAAAKAGRAAKRVEAHARGEHKAAGSSLCPSCVAEAAGWLVQTAAKGHDDWATRSGHVAASSAQREVRQLAPRWRREGLQVRVVPHN